jgi:NAD-dependent protein deacetylase/lipoamidase
MSSTRLDQLASVLGNTSSIAVLSGAGMSAESGVPTFRDELTGYWSRYDPADLATPEAFLRQPEVVFGWYLARLRHALDAVPHAGYDALAVLDRRFGGVPVITQNVDGLHSRAGTTRVIELHGSLSAFRCFEHAHPFPLASVLTIADDADGGPVLPPECPDCGSLVRPGVVWFGECLSPEGLEQSAAIAQEVDVFIVVGTSSVVYPAAQLPHLARASGATLIEINPTGTPLSALVQYHVSMSAREALPEIARLASSAVAA